jgi:NSS family neurotransmitter:Na+ symporter
MRVAHERFDGEWSFVLTALGITLGTGNVWRFPRIIAQEGGVFLIPWFVGLLLFCYPLLVAEAALGQRVRQGLVGAFANLGDRRNASLGTFLAVTTLGTLCFDAVVCGWCIHYFVDALTHDLFASPLAGQTYYHQREWLEFAGTWDAVPFLVVALGVAWTVVSRGVRRGIERMHRFAVPLVFSILFVLAVRGLTIAGVAAGLGHVFRIDWWRLTEPHLWYRGLLQAVGTTAAGWGWMLTYSGSMAPGTNRARAVGRVVAGCVIASLLATLALIPLAYGAEVSDALRRNLVSRAGGFMFVWVPTLLGRVSWGSILAILLYGALALATVLTLVAQLETVVRIGVDLGAERVRLSGALALMAAVLGFPSARSMAVLDGQSWIFETLALAGPALVGYAITRYGAERLYREVFAPEARPGIPERVFKVMFAVVAPAGTALLLAGQVLSTFRTSTSPGVAAFAPTGLGTVMLGALVVAIVARAFTPAIVQRTFEGQISVFPRGLSKTPPRPE